MMTKRAMGILVHRYRAVLKKCHLLNVFSSLAIAGMLVMGAATGEAFGYDVGYNVTSPSPSVGDTISADDSTSGAEARGVNAYTTGTHTVPDTVTTIEATANGKTSATTYGVLSESSTGASLTMQLNSDSLTITSNAATESGLGLSYGIWNYNSSSLSMNKGTIMSSAESQNGNSWSYGIFSGVNSTFSSGTDSLLHIDASAVSHGGATELFAYGINAEGMSEVTLNDANITVQTRTDQQITFNNAYGVSLGGDSTFSMQNGTINVFATDIDGKTLTGNAIGIMTNAGGSTNYAVDVNTVDIQVAGQSSSGIELARATMNMGGGSVTAISDGDQAMGINATSKTTFNTTGDIDFAVQARSDGTAIALHSESASSITALGGTVSVTSQGNGKATGLEAASGGSITKSAGNITVSSLDGTATGLDAQDTHGTYLSYNASTINYGNANTQTQISVYGNEAYGIRAFNNNTPTADNKPTSVEVTNGNITARASGSSAVGAYSISGNIALKGTTSITATSDSGQSVYSLYATAGGGDTSTITVDNASNIQGDIRTATTDSSIAATFQNGGHLKAWTYNTGNLGNISLTFGKDAVWEMVASNKLTKGTDGKYTGNLTSLSLDGSNVYVGSTQQQHAAGNGFASSQTLLSQTDAPAALEMETLSGSGNFYLRTDMEQDISDSVHVTKSLSGTHNLYVKASGAEPVATQTASYLA